MLDEQKIGYACTPISLEYKTTRSFILKNLSSDRFNECVHNNLADLIEILKWNLKKGIYMFRISSDIIPFGSHPQNNIEWWITFKQLLLSCGQFIKENRIRVSMHPGQYTILNSRDEDVVSRAIADIEYHCRFIDALDVDYTNKIVLHIGGVYGDKEGAIQRFMTNFERLSSSAKKRIVLENDEKNYNIEDILCICEKLKVPAIFDNLHHKINPCPLEIRCILNLVKDTWRESDGPMKLHYSDQDVDKKRGAHSKFIISKNFLQYFSLVKHYNPDIMLEVKDKEISAVKCLNILNEHIKASERYEQWAKYKYSAMEKNYSDYKKCSKIVNSDAHISELYEAIEHVLLKPFDEGNFKNTAFHVYGYVKDKVTIKEKSEFEKLLKNASENSGKIKIMLRRLCKKYNVEYVNNSYYFYY